MTYEQAISRLEEITQNLSTGKTNIDALVQQLTEAKTLIAFCRQQLTQVETDVNNLINESTDSQSAD